MPIDYSKYPKNWKRIVEKIRRRSGDRCEGSPRYPYCRVKNHTIHPVTGSMVILTVAHLDHDHTNNHLSNLRHMCQRCHLTHDAQQHAANASHTRELKRTAGIIPLFNMKEGLN